MLKLEHYDSGTPLVGVNHCMGSVESREPTVDDLLIYELESGNIDGYENLRQSISKWYYPRLRAGIQLSQPVFSHLFGHRRLITLLDDSWRRDGVHYQMGHNEYTKWESNTQPIIGLRFCFWENRHRQAHPRDAHMAEVQLSPKSVVFTEPGFFQTNCLIILSITPFTE